MSDDRPAPTRRTTIVPLYDAISLEFARRELTDERLAEVVGMWSK